MPNIENEREVKCFEYDLENLTKEEVVSLKAIGLREIQKDDGALINYAVNHILREMVTKTEGNIKTLKRLLKEKTDKKKK